MKTNSLKEKLDSSMIEVDKEIELSKKKLLFFDISKYALLGYGGLIILSNITGYNHQLDNKLSLSLAVVSIGVLHGISKPRNKEKTNLEVLKSKKQCLEDLVSIENLKSDDEGDLKQQKWYKQKEFVVKNTEVNNDKITTSKQKVLLYDRSKKVLAIFSSVALIPTIVLNNATLQNDFKRTTISLAITALGLLHGLSVLKQKENRNILAAKESKYCAQKHQNHLDTSAELSPKSLKLYPTKINI